MVVFVVYFMFEMLGCSVMGVVILEESVCLYGRGLYDVGRLDL